MITPFGECLFKSWQMMDLKITRAIRLTTVVGRTDSSVGLRDLTCNRQHSTLRWSTETDRSPFWSSDIGRTILQWTVGIVESRSNPPGRISKFLSQWKIEENEKFRKMFYPVGNDIKVRMISDCEQSFEDFGFLVLSFVMDLFENQIIEWHSPSTCRRIFCSLPQPCARHYLRCQPDHISFDCSKFLHSFCWSEFYPRRYWIRSLPLCLRWIIDWMMSLMSIL